MSFFPSALLDHAIRWIFSHKKLKCCMDNVILSHADKAVSIFNIILYHFTCWITNLPLRCVSSTIHKTLCPGINFPSYDQDQSAWLFVLLLYSSFSLLLSKNSSPKRAAAPRMMTSILQQLSLLKIIYLSLSFSKKSLIGCFFLVVVVLAVVLPFIASSMPAVPLFAPLSYWLVPVQRR